MGEGHVVMVPGGRFEVSDKFGAAAIAGGRAVLARSKQPEPEDAPEEDQPEPNKRPGRPKKSKQEN